jgi:C-terminal processing protease CtpA/Prc
MRLLTRLLPLILFCAVLVGQTPTPPSTLSNGNFESGTVGAFPPGWLPGSPQFVAEVTDEGCNSGKQCGLLRSAATATSDTFGNLSQNINAVPYRGKKIRYRASVRTLADQPQHRTQLWLRVDRPNGAVGLFDNMNDRPITSTSWATFEISGDVAPDAVSIVFGMLMRGTGRAWIDDATLEIIGDADPIEGPRPLTSRGLQNLQALTRLFGYVRYFHPSDETAAVDWNSLAIDAVRTVEPAQTPQELVERLRRVFDRIAPAIRIFATGTAAPALDSRTEERVIVWQHHGVGVSAQSIYRSTRIIRTVSQDVASLMTPLRADLPGGVSVIVPLAVYADAPPLPSAPPQGRIPGSGDDRASRLAGVMVAWNVFQHFYPYFDVVQTDWPEVLRTSLVSAAEDKNGIDFATTLNKLVAALHDGHGGVNGGPQTPLLAPAINLVMADGKVIAQFVRGQSPVAPGDAILSIDGKPVAEVLAAKEALISGATPQWIRYRALAVLLAAAPNTNLQVEVEPFAEPNTRRTVTLRASAVPIQTAEEPRPNKVSELEPGIFYVDLNRVTDADYAAALPSLINAKGIVFDMRGYPRMGNMGQFFGHLSREPMRSAQWNVPNITRPDHVDMPFVREGEWQLPPVAPYFTAKRAFITDGRAISFAESVMGIVEFFKLGEIVGEPTAGTNGNINPFPIPGGYTISWTGMKVLKQDGAQHHGVGILPTIPVSRTRAGIAAGRDEMLERAIQAVR